MSSMNTTPLYRKILSAFGSLGFALATYPMGNYLMYFYFSPEREGIPLFEPRIFQGSVLGILTVIGLILSLGKVIDAFTDPLVAGWTDRSKSRFGKRRKYMAIGAPLASLMMLLVFVPPTETGFTLNALYLAVTLGLFFLFITMYIIPYNLAMLVDMPKDSKDRLLISTITSIMWILGFGLGSQVVAVQSLLEKTMTPMGAFQTSLGLFAIVALFFMSFPIIFTRDSEDSRSKEMKEKNTLQALKAAIKNRNFVYFVLADLLNMTTNIVMSAGMIYYVTVIFQLEKSYYSIVIPAAMLISFTAYAPINILSRKWGKRKVLLIGFISLAIMFALIPLYSLVNMAPLAFLVPVIITAAIPMGVFGILPNAVIGDIAEADGIESGSHKPGMFFSSRSFSTKISQMIVNLIFPTLFLFGKSVENPLGVQLTAILGLVLTLLGIVFIVLYKEDHINAVLDSRNEVIIPEGMVEA